MSWFESFHDHLYADTVLSQRSPEKVHEQNHLIASLLQLKPASRVFDQCSGIGIMGNALAEIGHEVIGIDLVPSYVERANQAARTAQFICADAFTFCRPAYFDGAFNWWTSIGYAEADADNYQMIERAFESLKPGGRYLIETMNPPGVITQFKGEFIQHFPSVAGEITLLRQSTADLTRSRLKVDWSYTQNEMRLAKHHSSVRMFYPHELESAFKHAGFQNVEILGPNGQSLEPLDDLRYMVLGEKPFAHS